MKAVTDIIPILLPDLAWLFTQFLGFAGGILICYSVVAEYYSSPWEPIERAAGIMSPLLTILGTLVTAASIYIPSTVVHPPWPHSRFIVSPVVIAFCLVALLVLVRKRQLPPMLVNGFALLAMSGGLKRILPDMHLPT